MQIIPNPFSATSWRFWLAWLAAISLVSTGSADPAPKDDSIPTDLKISTGTFFGAKFTLELRDGDDLILRTTPGRGRENGVDCRSESLFRKVAGIPEQPRQAKRLVLEN